MARRGAREQRKDKSTNEALKACADYVLNHTTLHRHKAEVAERRKPKAAKAPRVL